MFHYFDLHSNSLCEVDENFSVLSWDSDFFFFHENKSQWGLFLHVSCKRIIVFNFKINLMHSTKYQRQYLYNQRDITKILVMLKKELPHQLCFGLDLACSLWLLGHLDIYSTYPFSIRFSLRFRIFSKVYSSACIISEGMQKNEARNQYEICQKKFQELYSFGNIKCGQFNRFKERKSRLKMSIFNLLTTPTRWWCTAMGIRFSILFSSILFFFSEWSDLYEEGEDRYKPDEEKTYQVPVHIR